VPSRQTAQSAAGQRHASRQSPTRAHTHDVGANTRASRLSLCLPSSATDSACQPMPKASLLRVLVRTIFSFVGRLKDGPLTQWTAFVPRRTSP
jgi:hypothetical protein